MDKWTARSVTGILVLKIMVRGTKIFNLLAENFGPGPKFSIDNPEKNGPPLKILVRGGRIRFNFLCCVTATNKQSGIIEIEVVGHKLQQCKGVGACAAPGDRESSGPFCCHSDVSWRHCDSITAPRFKHGNDRQKQKLDDKF